MWDITKIKVNDDEKIAIAPLIISASRATDIPAFYMEWFANRLNKGYLKWVNPFDKKPQYVSFEKVRFIVFWSKNPQPLLKYTNDLESKGIGYYLQYTLNDYENEGYEPGLPQLNKRIETFKNISKAIGKEKVLWRFDPLLLTDRISVSSLVEKIERVGNEISKYTEKMIFSYADIEGYKKVASNLKKNRIQYKDFDSAQMEEIALKISKMAKKWGIKVATCGEKIDLSSYCIEHNKCIDDELILRISPNDSQLRKFILGENANQLSIFENNHTRNECLKDKGQRPECKCIPSKDIGSYNTCCHLCVYCYANTSEEAVKKNKVRTRYTNEALVE